MTSTHGSSGRPAAAPRHLSRRRFRPDIPDARFVSESLARQSYAQIETSLGGRLNDESKQHGLLQAREMQHRRKRRVALAIVLLVLGSIPILGLALLLSL